MLRIHINHGNEATLYIIEGKLIGPWVTELEKCWHTAVSREPYRSIVIDITAVTFIDDQGKQLVTRMRQNGAALTGTGLMAEFLIREIENATSSPETGSVT